MIFFLINTEMIEPPTVVQCDEHVSKSICMRTFLGACLETGDRIFATGSDTVSKYLLRSCACFCSISGHTVMAWKGPRHPKHVAIIIFLWSYLSPLTSLLGQDPCGDRILQSCLQKAPAIAHSNYNANKAKTDMRHFCLKHLKNETLVFKMR